MVERLVPPSSGPPQYEIRFPISRDRRALDRRSAHLRAALYFFFLQAADGIRDFHVTGVQTCALPICHQRVESVTIDPEALDPDDVETLQDLMVAGFNEALKKSQDLAGQRLGALTG